MDIILKSVSKSFNDKSVINNFSHIFCQGKIYCLMGESGCGKTTMLNLIMGFLKPDKGEILGNNQKISAVFQEDRLCEAFTPVGNLMAVAKGNDLTKIDMLLSELRLDEHKTKPVSQLSGGQKRRVAIARALFAESNVLILDEPFKGLDESLRAQVIETILANTLGKTIIVATHDIKDCQLLNAEVLDLGL